MSIWQDIQRHCGVEPDGVPGPATADAIAKALGLHSAASDIMRIGPKGMALIKNSEGLELKAYPDPATGGDPWTVGVGHTGPEVKPGMVITEAQADGFLRSDLSLFESGVRNLVPMVTQCQFDALVSFAFNCGLGNLKSSTLLKKHNAGDHDGAANEFVRWNKANGAVMRGLTKRRLAEAALYRGQS